MTTVSVRANEAGRGHVLVDGTEVPARAVRINAHATQGTTA